MCKHLEITIEMALILFYSQTYLRLVVSELDFERSGVVMGLVLGISVSMHFLNNTNTLYITNTMCANLWSHNWSVAYPIYSQRYLRLAVSELEFKRSGL